MNTNKKQRRKTYAFFIFTVFVILLATAILEAGISVIVYKTNIFDYDLLSNEGFTVLIIFLSASIIIGTFLSWGLSKIFLRPVNKLIRALNDLSDGKFSTRIDLGKIYIAKNISTSFNTLAKELENTEMLRSDFTNNFSHEFKTPIVSIYGFAKLINSGKLDEETKKEYLKIIEEEAKRLSSMATNVLNLTKIENQAILTNVTRFNLSEQIRLSILLFEKDLEKKNLSLDVELDEVFVLGNEELLKQVWINLLSNAVKFSNENTQITVLNKTVNGKTAISITNEGEVIKEEDKQKIWNKFYQTDKSHNVEGHGLGLSIVKKIVDLHGGKIVLETNENKNTFTVILNS